MLSAFEVCASDDAVSGNLLLSLPSTKGSTEEEEGEEEGSGLFDR